MGQNSRGINWADKFQNGSRSYSNTYIYMGFNRQQKKNENRDKSTWISKKDTTKGKAETSNKAEVLDMAQMEKDSTIPAVQDPSLSNEPRLPKEKTISKPSVEENCCTNNNSITTDSNHNKIGIYTMVNLPHPGRTPKSKESLPNYSSNLGKPPDQSKHFSLKSKLKIKG
ncbi:OLC1v1035565C1 [Oldenlandia corymbosa var. corymbosa]|uniref:OLC1v1035565C1 n=1 Tax=Oldenlandia corymbosa var. corymbosa TaxID=529605 RepID=A0AAV1CVT8_OLDCO|nr:OLC1v1035565C1 [Oldenlandia corymbosa var. corymbosa]